MHDWAFPHNSHGRDKWWDFVDGKDGFFYGIPSNARSVVKFNPLDKSFVDWDWTWPWRGWMQSGGVVGCGVRGANNGKSIARLLCSYDKM